MIDGLPLGILEFDNDWHLRLINDAAYAFLNLNPAVDPKNFGLHEFFQEPSIELLKKKATELGSAKVSTFVELQVIAGTSLATAVLCSVMWTVAQGEPNGYRIIMIEAAQKVSLTVLPEDAFFAKYDISKREKEVIILLLKGFSNRDICEKLCISESTVKKHSSNLFQKTHCSSRRELLQLVKSEKVY
jgi:ATP/maltotriose-dependent transcriptional regulator MalT